MDLKEQINKIKPETGENSKAIKNIIERIEEQISKAERMGKNYVYFDLQVTKAFKDVLTDVMIKMVYHIMLLQKCSNIPLKNAIQPNTEQRLVEMVEMNKKLVIRNHWLEKYLKLKKPYYAVKESDLPELKTK